MTIRYSQYNDAAALRYKGVWSSLTSYNMTDLVYFAGSVYSCVVVPCSGASPTGTSNWTLFANGSKASPFPTPATSGLGPGDELRIAGLPTKTVRATNITMTLTNGANTVTFANAGVAVLDASTVVSLYEMIGNDEIGYYSVNTLSGAIAGLNKTWAGETQDVPLYKLNTIKVTLPAGHKLIDTTLATGAQGNPLRISGNWNLSLGTPDQSAFTHFVQSVQLAFTGNGVQCWSNSWIEVSNLGFSRYTYGVYGSSMPTDITVRNITAESCTTGLYATSGLRWIIADCTARRCTTGFYCSDQANYFRIRNCLADLTTTGIDFRGSNSEIRDCQHSGNAYDISMRSGAHNRVLGMVSTGSVFMIEALNTYDTIFVVTTNEPATGASYNIQLSGCKQTRVYISGTPVKVRCNNYIVATADNVIVGHAGISTALDISFPGVLAEYTGVDSAGKATISKLHGTCNQVDASDINEVTQHAPSARLWKLNPTTATSAEFPLTMRIARANVAANKPVTASIWMKRSLLDTRIGGSLVCVEENAGVQITEAALPDPVPSPVNANDFVKITLTVTPTRSGVIAFEVRSWLSGSLGSGALYVDGFSVRQ